MKQFLLALLLLAAALSGCTDDADDHGDGCEDAADHDACHEAMEGGRGGSSGGSTDPGNSTSGNGGTGIDETQRQTVDVEIAWNGVYRVNGAYSQGTITVPANSTVNLTFTNNDSAFGHDFVVEDVEGAATAVLGNGQSETITFNVDGPMETQFFCAVPGHRDGGMEGSFIVE